MSHSDDLDWLARNVHEWKEGKIECIPMSPYKVESVVWSSMSPCEGWITKDQWLARRAELQNKPNFADHPDAKCFAQDDAGHWYKNVITDEVYPRSHFWWMDFDGYQHNGFTLICKGELLGDWRDTLEKRPDMNKSHEEIDTSAERVQKSAKSMHDWHESGELPPVGTKCEYRLSTSAPWYPCEIKYVIHGDGVVMMREDGFEQFCSINSKLQPVSFRPIRTERDEAIEAMKAHCPYPGSWETTYRLFAESLYDAGYRAGCSE